MSRTHYRAWRSGCSWQYRKPICKIVFLRIWNAIKSRGGKTKK